MNLRILAVNIGGLWKKKDEVELVINKMKPDILCLCETHINEEILDYEIDIKNYSMIRTNTKNNRTGGTMTYVKENIKYKVVLNNSEIVEGIWLNSIKVGNSEDCLVLCNIYRSPSSSISIFCDKILEIAEQLLDYGRLIMLGDFNVDMLKNDYYAKKLSDEMSYLGMKQNIKTPTRSTLTSKTIIDLVFTNFRVESSVLQTPKLSDHNIICIQTEQVDSVDNNITVYSRNFKKFSDVLFQTEIYNKFNNWQTELSICDSIIDCDNSSNSDNNSHIVNFELNVNKINQNVLDVLDKLAPFEKKSKSIKWTNKPWIDNEIIKLIRARDKLYRLAMRSKLESDMNQYKILRNKVVNNIRLNKKQYYETNISNNKNNSKYMWKTLKELIGDKKNTKKNLREMLIDNNIVCDNQVIANKLNEYFIYSIDDIINEIYCGMSYNEEINENIEPHSINKWESFDKIDINTIDKIINKLNITKGSKNDVNVKILRLIWSVRSDIIFYMINNSLRLGLVPPNWKISTITPIQKVAGSNKIVDQRPINTLPVYEQVLEEVIKL